MVYSFMCKYIHIYIYYVFVIYIYIYICSLSVLAQVNAATNATAACQRLLLEQFRRSKLCDNFRLSETTHLNLNLSRIPVSEFKQIHTGSCNPAEITLVSKSWNGFGKSTAYRKVFAMQKPWSVEVVRCINEGANGCWDDHDMKESMQSSRDEPMNQGFNESMNQGSMNQQINQSMKQWITETMNQWFNNSMKQQVNESTAQRLNESVKQRVSESMNQWLNDPMSQSINESANQKKHS